MTLIEKIKQALILLGAKEEPDPKHPRIAIARYLYNQLEQDMLSLDDIAHLLYIIESIYIEEGKGEDKTMTTLETKLQQPVLNSFKNPETGFNHTTFNQLQQLSSEEEELLNPAFTFRRNRKFIEALTHIHQDLYNLLSELFNKIKNPDQIADTLELSSLDVAASPMLSDIETRSHKPALSDNSNIEKDVFRKLVSFEGEFYDKGKEGSLDDEDREKIKDIIESLTGDKVAEEGSQANKIFHFGNQALLGDFTSDTQDVTTMNGEAIVTNTFRRSNINWKQVDNQIVADVSTDLISFMKEGDAYILNTEGTKLIKLDISSSAGEKIMLDMNKENPQRRLPILRINATISLIKDEKGYYTYKVLSRRISYFTDELQGKKRLSEDLHNSSIIKELNETNFDDPINIKKNLQLLASLAPHQLDMLKQYSDLYPTSNMKKNTAALLLEQRIHKYLPSEEVKTGFLNKRQEKQLEKKMLTAFHEKPFNSSLKERRLSWSKPDLDKDLKNFFDKLKSNEMIDLQDIQNIYNKFHDQNHPEKVQAQLIYTLKVLNHNNNPSISTLDKSKLQALASEMERRDYKSDHPARKLVNQFLAAVNMVTNNPPLKTEQALTTDYAGKVLLYSEATHLVSKFNYAREAIEKSEQNCTKDEKKSLLGLKTELITGSRCLVSKMAHKELDVTYFNDRVTLVERKMEATLSSFNKPSTIFQRIASAVRKFLGKKPNPSVLDTLKQLKEKLAEETPSPDMRPRF